MDIRVPLVGLGPLMRLGTSVVFIAAAVLPEGSAVAQFAPRRRTVTERWLDRLARVSERWR